MDGDCAGRSSTLHGVPSGSYTERRSLEVARDDCALKRSEQSDARSAQFVMIGCCCLLPRLLRDKWLKLPNRLNVSNKVNE